MKKLLFVLVIILSVLVAACNGQSEPIAASKKPVLANARWYSAAQVSQGEKLFREHCAGCHGDQAQGLAQDWTKTLQDGSYPPPPLNGTAHAWHHPLPLLIRTIDRGGVPLGGVMPGFREKMNNDEKLAVIAYFQNLWPEEIYQHWEKRNGAEL